MAITGTLLRSSTPDLITIIPAIGVLVKGFVKIIIAGRSSVKDSGKRIGAGGSFVKDLVKITIAGRVIR